MARDPRVFIIGEDVGVLGDVNQNFKGLQEKFGESRITDTGIREATILGQGIGAAMRGLRPVVDIQYLDYLLYCFQLLSDDVATLHYRSAGGQIAPVVVRTKGHRLEGIWHTGSPMGTIVHGLRGMHICVPRNMVQAAGMYNTLFQGDDPALVIEVLSGYRLREALPENIDHFTVPLGMPEILIPGDDVTIVTYGACVRIAEEAAKFLDTLGISVELIDVQTLLPFDINRVILTSIRKTNAVLFLDEDVPGGATAYMLQQVLEIQGAYDELDAPPRTLTGAAHRSPYGSDGDYWCKPSAEDVVETVYAMMRERRPAVFPKI
jgi:pyruvate/2-oxoglutarate/acetoin dehydrogenase E1 component